MKPTPRDYTNMTELCSHLGLTPYKNRLGNIQRGVYCYTGWEAPVDLSACAEDNESILKTALAQLSERVDAAYHDAIERDLQD